MPTDFDRDGGWRKARPGTHSGEHIRRLAKRCIEAARNEIPAHSGLLVSVKTGELGVIRLQWWHPSAGCCAEIAASPSGFSFRTTSIGALQRAGAALLAHLARRQGSGSAQTLVTNGWEIAVREGQLSVRNLAGFRYEPDMFATVGPATPRGPVQGSLVTIH